VAEDNPINQQLAIEFLEKAGAKVEIAENGLEAVSRATQKPYDVILMDIHMPEMDGLTACQALRDQGTNVPIIAVSADALTDSKSKALDAGCNGYITKPIDFDKLQTEIHRWLPDKKVDFKRRATDAEKLQDLEDLEDKEKTATRPRLRRVPGIDIGLAIHNHNDNIKLMTKLMGDFGTYYGDAGQRMREAILKENWEDAERLAHNLHGVAGSFGALRLKEASKILELALVEGNAKNLLGLSQSFEVALTEVLESAEALARDEIQLRASDYKEDSKKPKD
jgi:CheY-like chemotaxis protein/HPt (histidine-containing phosphotransfer) domain-containing protein